MVQVLLIPVLSLVGVGGTNDSGAARVNFQAFTEKLISFYMDAKLMKMNPGLLASPKEDCLRK